MKYLLVVAAAFVAAGCACAPGVTPALFVVVPAADGHIGKIVVQANGGEARVIDTAYGSQRLRPDGKVEVATLSQAEVSATFGPTMAALPGRPTSYTLYFLEGKDELTPESKLELDKVFSELKTRPLPDIVVIGHTDTVGGLEYNDRLSRARAERLREMLVELGIPADRITAAGRGKRELLVPTEDNISEARNRRVEINVR
ncbi:MAG TPA: OmpA family protein [Usitatibacter sp.]|nr:OmpA family protein [Usitatibacter sp.]